MVKGRVEKTLLGEVRLLSSPTLLSLSLSLSHTHTHTHTHLSLTLLLATLQFILVPFKVLLLHFCWQCSLLSTQPSTLPSHALPQVSQYIEEVYEPDECYIRIKLDQSRIKLLKVGQLNGWFQ